MHIEGVFWAIVIAYSQVVSTINLDKQFMVMSTIGNKLIWRSKTNNIWMLQIELGSKVLLLHKCDTFKWLVLLVVRPIFIYGSAFCSLFFVCCYRSKIYLPSFFVSRVSNSLGRVRICPFSTSSLWDDTHKLSNGSPRCIW